VLDWCINHYDQTITADFQFCVYIYIAVAFAHSHGALRHYVDSSQIAHFLLLSEVFRADADNIFIIYDKPQYFEEQKSSKIAIEIGKSTLNEAFLIL